MRNALRTSAIVIFALSLCCPSHTLARTKAPKAKNRENGAVYKCLPAGTKPDDIVSADNGSTVSVAEKLHEIAATCKGKKLIGKTGKPIYFYPLTGCWGNPPEGYQEIMAEQERKIAELEKTHEVIRMTCNTAGVDIP
jgi:hypothetical protein